MRELAASSGSESLEVWIEAADSKAWPASLPLMGHFRIMLKRYLFWGKGNRDWRGACTLFLYSESVGGLSVQVCGVFKFLGSTAKEREARARALGSLVCLWFEVIR